MREDPAEGRCPSRTPSRGGGAAPSGAATIEIKCGDLACALAHCMPTGTPFDPNP
ncbi:hypothetical protein ACWERI_14810 [Streptomyces collinus]